MRRWSCIFTDGSQVNMYGPCAWEGDHGDAYFLIHSMYMVICMPECMYMAIHGHGPMGMHRRQCVAGLASESAPSARGRQWAQIPRAPNGNKPARSSPQLLRIPAFCSTHNLATSTFLLGQFLSRIVFAKERSSYLIQSARTVAYFGHFWRFVPIAFLVGFFVRG